jgi:hypothetical protein
MFQPICQPDNVNSLAGGRWMNVKHAQRVAKDKDIVRRVAQDMEESLSQHFDIQVSILLIDAASDSAWKEQWQPYLAKFGRRPPNGGWEWPTWTRCCRKHSKKIGVAIWQANKLCGLCYAEANNTSAKIRMIEGDPRKRYSRNNIDVLLVFTLLFEAYCDEVGLLYTDLIDPARHLIPRYESLGYQLVTMDKKSNMMRKEI